MDGLVVEGRGHVEAVELGQLAGEDELDDDCDQASGVHGAGGHVDHGGLDAVVLHELLDAAGAHGVGVGCDEAAVNGAGACGDDCSRVLACLGQGAVGGAHGDGFVVRAVAHGEGVAVACGHDGALDDEDVLAASVLDGLLASLLEGVAGAGTQGLGVVQGDVLHDDGCGVRIISLSKGLGAAGARAQLHPNHGEQGALRLADEELLLDRLSHFDFRDALDADCSCNGTAERQERTTGHAS